MEDKEKKQEDLDSEQKLEDKKNPADNISNENNPKKSKKDISEHDSDIPTDKKNKKGLFEKFRENPWIVSTIVLGILVLILLFMNFINTDNGVTGDVVSAEVAGNNLLGFAEAQNIPGGAELTSIDSYNSYFYKAVLSIQGQQIPIYITKDGEYMVSDPISLNQSASEVIDQTPQQETEPSTSYSEEETAELKKFNDCLADEGLVIYGSETCPHCQNLVKTLGGYDAASSVYIECMEDQQRCAEEMKGQGVPEIQINGEKFDGGRSIEILAEATGCPVPEISA